MAPWGKKDKKKDPPAQSAKVSKKDVKLARDVAQAKKDVGVLKQKAALKAVTGSTKVRMVPGQFVGDIFHGLGKKDVKLAEDFFEWGGRTYHVGDSDEVSFFMDGKPFMLYDQEYAEPLRFKKGKIESFFSVTLQRLVKDNIIRNVAPKVEKPAVSGWSTGMVIAVVAIAAFAAFVLGALIHPGVVTQAGNGFGGFVGGSTTTVTTTATSAATSITTHATSSIPIPGG